MRIFPGHRTRTATREEGYNQAPGQQLSYVSIPGRPLSLRFRLAAISNGLKVRTGLTLVEMALATAVTAVFTLYVTMFVASGVQAQVESDRLSVAASLAQTKMSQLLSTPTLEQTGANPQAHVFDRNSGIYAGYEVKVAVSQDKVNLQQSLSEGQIKSAPIDDKLPASVQNQVAKEESMGRADSYNALGDVNVFRIVIDIKIPLGPDEFEMYRVETLRSAEKPPEVGTP
ncbi:MAG: hypothetical protein KDK25_07260 [Leptospiraceae bacterium]|nr:hypothetical protein [Leptospiraceae bacterium]